MDISYFLEFALIVKHGNLSEAAKELHTAQPVLSRHISAIEKEFGITLFDRTAKPMELTPSGVLFLKKSVTIANEYTRLMTCFHGFNEGSLETIKVCGLLDSGAAQVFRKAKTALLKTQPNISVKLMSPNYQTPFDALRDGEMDVAIEPISDLIEIHELESIEIIKERPYVVVEESHELASREEICSRDLESISFISLRSNRDNALRKHLQGICKQAGLEGAVPEKLGLSSANSYSELFLMGLDEDAVMIPKTMADMYVGPSGGQYVAIPFRGEEYFYDIRAFYLPQPASKVARFLEQLKTAREQVS